VMCLITLWKSTSNRVLNSFSYITEVHFSSGGFELRKFTSGYVGLRKSTSNFECLTKVDFWFWFHSFDSETKLY